MIIYNCSKEIFNILNITFKILKKFNIKYIRPFDLFISILYSNNFISFLLNYNKINLNKIYNIFNNKNYLKFVFINKIYISKEILNIFYILLNKNILITSLDLFKYLLNLNDILIIFFLKNILNININLLKNQIIKFYSIFFLNNFFLLNICYPLNISNNIIFRKESFNIIKLINKLYKKNIMVLGNKGIGKKKLIENFYYLLKNNIINNNKININKNIWILNYIKLIELLKYNNLFFIFNKILKLLFKYILKNNLLLLIYNIYILLLNDSFNFFILFKLINKLYSILFITLLEKKELQQIINKKNNILLNLFYKIKLTEPNSYLNLKILYKNYINFKNYYNININLYIFKLINNLSYKFIKYLNNPFKSLYILDTNYSEGFLNNIINNNFKKIKINQKIIKTKIFKNKNIFNNILIFYINKNKINVYDYNYIFNLWYINIKFILKLYYFILKLIYLYKFNYNNILLNNINLFKYIYNILLLLIKTINIPNVNGKITKKNIIKTISNLSNLPLNIISSNYINKKKLNKFFIILNNNIYGQKHILNIIFNNIKRFIIGLKNKNKPIASYIFAGLSGTGKTELAKLISNHFFNNKNALLRLDMSEYVEKHSTSKLIGSPPGYIGYEEGGILTSFVNKNQYSLILFDEIEKAHKDITNTLLQLLDDGILTDSKGNIINFSNTIIIFTTNLGCPKNLNQLPLLNYNQLLHPKEFNFFSNKINNAIELFFKPEFLNRIDNILIFKPLDFYNLYNITNKFLKIIKNNLKKQKLNITLLINLQFKLFLTKLSFKPLYGARPIQRLIKYLIENPITNFILNFKIKYFYIFVFYINYNTYKPNYSINIKL